MWGGLKIFTAKVAIEACPRGSARCKLRRERRIILCAIIMAVLSAGFWMAIRQTR